MGCETYKWECALWLGWRGRGEWELQSCKDCILNKQNLLRQLLITKGEMETLIPGFLQPYCLFIYLFKIIIIL